MIRFMNFLLYRYYQWKYVTAKTRYDSDRFLNTYRKLESEYKRGSFYEMGRTIIL